MRYQPCRELIEWFSINSAPVSCNRFTTKAVSSGTWQNPDKLPSLASSDIDIVLYHKGHAPERLGRIIRAQTRCFSQQVRLGKKAQEDAPVCNRVYACINLFDDLCWCRSARIALRKDVKVSGISSIMPDLYHLRYAGGPPAYAPRISGRTVKQLLLSHKSGAQIAPAPGQMMRHLNFEFIEGVIRAGSIRKASEDMNITASALNRRINRFEDEFGYEIFERLPRGVRLNPGVSCYTISGPIVRILRV